MRLDNTKPRKLKVKGLGWTGLWLGGLPGWFTTHHVSDGASDSLFAWNPNMVGGRFYRCEITVRILRDSRGRFIRRRAR